MTSAVNAEQVAGSPAAPPANTQATVAVSVAHLSKTYPVPLTRLKRLFGRQGGGPVEALNDVSFEIAEGEIFGLIGRNGAGKTTIAKIIATLVQPTAGSVTVRGYDSVRDEDLVRAQVGLASAEERSFYWRLTVEQNLLFFARLYGQSDRAARDRIAELLARFELEPLARRRFGELSTGNKQRMAVARALLNSPPVLLLDEPTRSLDPLAAAQMRALIGTLARANPPFTVLLTSHNLAEVEELCGRIAIISRGRIRALDTPKALRALHKQTEKIRLLLRDISPAEAARALTPEAFAIEMTEREGLTAVAFAREPGDERLDRVVRALYQSGARLVSIETEQATLLDVLESYEREQEGKS